MNLFIPIILIIISIGVFFTYIDTEYQDILELKKTKKNFVDQELKTNKIIKERRELIERYEKIDPESEKGLQKLLPNHVDNVELIVDIQRIIKENGIGIQISDISLTKVNSAKKTKNGQIEFEDEKKYNSIDVSFSFTTKYDIFKRFMSNIKESLRVLDVVSINFKPQIKKLGESSDNFKFDIKLRTY
jgi:Tfp pilus assembly protein PilO